MNSIYENQYLINSFHATKNDSTHTVIAEDGGGYIEPAVGTEICFLGPISQRPVPVNTILVTAGEEDIKLALNGNEMYPFYVPAGKTKGVNYMYVHTMKLLSGGSFSYEAMTDKF